MTKESTPPWEMSDEITKPPLEEPTKKSTRGKKPISEFEIFRTIFQRTSDRKLAYMFRNVGEDQDTFLLSSLQEEDLFFASAELTIGLIRLSNPNIKADMMKYIDKFHGIRSTNATVINIRDQTSKLVKTKGEEMEGEVMVDGLSSAWEIRLDKNGKERIVYLSKPVSSLYHFQYVNKWLSTYKPLLDPIHEDLLQIPYSVTDSPTAILFQVPSDILGDHPLRQKYPHGFRQFMTRGIDVVVTKNFESLPYAVKEQHMVVVSDEDGVTQLVHRVIGEGWEMCLVRPFSYIFPLHRNHSVK